MKGIGPDATTDDRGLFLTGMFELTFLGHQGWLVSSRGHRLLIDPLLGDRVGRGGRVGVPFPPRRFGPEPMPPCDAVLFTHEHCDHFDPGSLARLERHTRVLHSSRSSRALRQVVAELGFAGEPLSPGDVVRVGELELHLFAPDHRGGHNLDEWDVLPFVVRESNGHGTLLSAVDVSPPPGFHAAAVARAGRPSVVALANNVVDLGFLHAQTPRPTPTSAAALAELLAVELESVAAAGGGHPLALVTGSGLSFDGEQAWLNEALFTAENAAVATALERLRPEAHVSAPRPGETWRFVGGRLVEHHTRAPWLGCALEAQWPSRRFTEPAAPRPPPPVLTPEPVDEDALALGLEDLARFLYGTPVFEDLLSLEEGDGAAPALGLRLRERSGVRMLEYAPSDCTFLPAVGRPTVCGLELWAHDLVALLEGRIDADALFYGRSRWWNHDATRVRFGPTELLRWRHPLRAPDAALTLYRREAGLAPALAGPGERSRHAPHSRSQAAHPLRSA